jgi:hypothetical protein
MFVPPNRGIVPKVQTIGQVHGISFRLMESKISFDET